MRDALLGLLGVCGWLSLKSRVGEGPLHLLEEFLAILMHHPSLLLLLQLLIEQVVRRLPESRVHQ